MNSEPLKFSLSKAALEVGVSKPTISKAIKSGRLSATKVKGGRGGYLIEPSELFRVYPKVTVKEPIKIDDQLTVGDKVLETENKLLKKRIEDMRASLEREQEVARNLQKTVDHYQTLLTDQREPKRKKGWFW